MYSSNCSLLSNLYLRPSQAIFNELFVIDYFEETLGQTLEELYCSAEKLGVNKLINQLHQETSVLYTIQTTERVFLLLGRGILSNILGTKVKF